MKNLILYTLLAALISVNSSFAIDNEHIRASFNPKYSPDQCAVLLTECFAFDDEDKSSCFKESADNVFCKGSDLGKLAQKRWLLLAPNMANQDDRNPLVPENGLVDKDCMDNFDNLFSAKLLQGAINKAEILKLSQSLDSCRIDNSIELNRQ